MHVSEGLGFSSLVLVVVCLAFPVVAHVIRRKWRRSVARTEEIKRLLVLAAEEAARAEMEATVGYGSPVVSVSRGSYQCAVCYSPTTTRCARCKAVRYCSGKCQIIHWRQGHKEECRPPSTIYHSNDDGRNFADIAKGKGQHGITDESYEKESIGTSYLEHVTASPGRMLKVPPATDDNIVVACIADATEKFSASESGSDTFSGFSASPSARESSSDGSASESISSNEGPDAQISYDISVDILDHTFDKMDRTNSLSPKFASLVDSASDFNKSSKVNQSKQCSHDGESQDASTKSPDHISSMCEISVVKPGKISSGFWGRMLESVTSSSDALDGSPLSNSIAAGSIDCSDDESLQQPKQSGNNVTSLHAQDPESKGLIDDSHLGALNTNKPVGGGALPENTHAYVQKSRTSPSSGTSNLVENHSTAKSNVTKPSEPNSSLSSISVAYPSSEAGRDAVRTDMNVSSSQSSYSGRSNIVNSFVGTSLLHHSSLAADASCQRHASSDASGLSVPSLKTEKATSAESTSVTSTQMVSHSAANSISGLTSSVRKVVEHFKGPKIHCDKGLFPYDLFVRLYTSNKVTMQPCGLINCGNSCYTNVVLQCLAFTPPLAAYFFQGLHSKACVNKEWCLICEFEDLVLKAKEGQSSLSPIGIMSQLENIGRHLGRGREEDAHEFLRYAIDTMQSIFLKEAELKAGSVEEETTLIGLTFGGYLRSKIKCTKCLYKSEQHERMMDLTVEIEGDVEKLEDALRRFTSTEILDGDNKYLCSRCKSYEKAKKKLTIMEAPNVLTIALKRFQSGKFGKLNKSIQFQEILDLAPYMSGTSDKSPIYRLYGVVVHLDIMNAAFSGHYVCYVKNIQNKWFKVDDSLVTPVERDKVLSSGAYMLLYTRCVPRAPKLIRNHIIFSDPKNKGSPTDICWKSNVLNSRSSTCLSIVQLQPNPVSPNNMSNVESFYLRFHRLQRVFEEDSSSDTYSFTSSNSDEGSCSTDSTRESTSTEDFSDYIFGTRNSPWRNTSEADASSSSPSYTKHSSSKFQTSFIDSAVEDDDTWDRPRDQFFHSDANKHCRKAVNSSCRKSDKEKVGMG